jgi:ribosome-binding factor A
VENRSAQHHRERLTEAIKDEITTILTGELGDPRIGLVNVTQIVMAPAGKAARVYVSVQGTEEEAKASLDGLRDAVGFVRHKLAETLGLRRAPELTFHLDNSDQYSSRIDELLHRADKQERKIKRK